MRYYENELLAKSADTGILDIECDNDGFIFNKAFDANKVDYSAGNYNVNLVSAKEYYCDQQVDWLIGKYILPGNTIIEAGCGNGYFCKKIAKKCNCQIYGFDTSYVLNGVDNIENLKFYQKYYNKSCELKPDIVICRHVIEHISTPIEFLEDITYNIKDGGLLFLEMPDAEWILKNNVIYDFFYEHCSYWTLTSIARVLMLVGFEIIEALPEFENQNLKIIAKKTHKKININLYQNVTKILKLCHDFRNTRKDILDGIILRLQELKKSDVMIAVFGAAAKGVTFVNLFDPEKEYISYLIDDDPEKQGMFVGVTGHRIISPNEFKRVEGSRAVVIIMNNNYLQTKRNEFNNIPIITFEDLYFRRNVL
jgi:2-polyprenyl-3-methyl-5-hydroxy-6-metoxy-1,4-benzoquinol methylase